MVDQSIIDEWLAKADEDYLFTEKYLQNEESFFAPLCFHCQQAAEKYLKSYIVAKELSFLKIHDINELREVCQDHEESFEEIRDECALLSRYYIDTRYPTVWPVGYTKEDAWTALEAVGRIREFVKTKLSR